MVFSQIEIQSPIYQVCISKRISGVQNRKWDILPIDDSVEAKRQAKEVKKMFLDADTRNNDGLTDALEHLVLGAFRGRSAVKPFFDKDGRLLFKKLNNWNVLEYNNQFFWNPSSEEVPWLDQEKVSTIQRIPEGEICYLQYASPIDIPGLMLYLRQLVGENQWARFVEKSGIPQVIITAPDGTPNTALAEWNYRAQQIFEGGSGTLPHDSDVHLLTEARGQDPFSEYIRHQMDMISILATGGTLMTIGGSTGLGSDLARVQQESFNSIVNRDCKKLSNAITESVVGKCVRKRFGESTNVLCRFTFIEDDEYSANDYLDMAVKLNGLGVKIDSEKLKEITKLSFIADKQEEWIPNKQPSKEWTVEEKEQLKKELEEGDK